jgi:hypothetical protein
VIAFTRSLARQLRAVLRKSVWAAAPRGARPPVVFHATDDRLSIRAYDPEVSVVYSISGEHRPEVLALPAEILDDSEGRGEDVITLEPNGSGAIKARWDDAGVPQVRDYDARDLDSLPAFPELPSRWATLEPGFLKALTDASHTAAKDNPRYAVHRIQCRGTAGEIVATDGRELLIQTGFTLPWEEDLLVPCVAAFASREVPQDVPVALVKTDTHVGIRVGAWTFLLAIDKEGRFPKVDNVVPALNGKLTTCRLSAEDAAFLSKALPRLPGGEDENAPLTLDLNGQAAIRVRGNGQPQATEVILGRSEVDGPPVRLASNRQYLARALHLGFTQIEVVKVDVPLVCRDSRRTYVWMPLGKDDAVAPSDNSLRIFSTPEQPLAEPASNERRKSIVTAPKTNGNANVADSTDHANTNGATPQITTTGGRTLIEEAQELRDALREAYGRANRLVAVIKRQRQQSKLVATTLASLRQLQNIGG